jgi:hypothetical protein
MLSAMNGAVETDKIGGISTQPDKPISTGSPSTPSRSLTGSPEATGGRAVPDKIAQGAVVISNLSVRRHADNPHAYDVDMTCSVLGKNA